MVLLKINKEKGEWEQITEEEKKELPEDIQENDVIYLDGKLKKKLDFALKEQAGNDDCPFLIVGDEGTGKGGITGNILRYVSKNKYDPKLHMIGHDYLDGLQKLKNIQKFGWLHYDEGNEYFLSTEIMKRESRDLHKIFSIIRQKCLFVAINMPSFFRAQSYFAIDRTKFVIRVYKKGGKRGFFAYYGKKTKAKLYMMGRKHHNYDAVRPNFRGRFRECVLLENKDYTDFKEETLDGAIEHAIQLKKANKKLSQTDIKRKLVKDLILSNPDKPARELAAILSLSTRRVEQIRKEANDRRISEL